MSLRLSHGQPYARAAAALIDPYSQLFGNFQNLSERSQTLPEAERGSCTDRACVGRCGCEHRAMLPASWQAFMAYSLINVYGFGGSFAYSFLETHSSVRASRPASAAMFCIERGLRFGSAAVARKNRRSAPVLSD